MTEQDRGERPDDTQKGAPSLAGPEKVRHDGPVPRHLAGGVDTPDGTESDQDVEGRGGP